MNKEEKDMIDAIADTYIAFGQALKDAKSIKMMCDAAISFNAMTTDMLDLVKKVTDLVK